MHAFIALRFIVESNCFTFQWIFINQNFSVKVKLPHHVYACLYRIAFYCSIKLLSFFQCILIYQNFSVKSCHIMFMYTFITLHSVVVSNCLSFQWKLISQLKSCCHIMFMYTFIALRSVVVSNCLSFQWIFINQNISVKVKLPHHVYACVYHIAFYCSIKLLSFFQCILIYQNFSI